MECGDNIIELDFDKNNGIVAVMAQDYKTKEILMQAYMNREAWIETVNSKRAVYFSRSRNRLWRKGESSGNIQIIKEIRVDCDLDSVLLMIEQVGDAACHEGYRSCFYRTVAEDGLTIKGKLIFDPKEVYKK